MTDSAPNHSGHNQRGPDQMAEKQPELELRGKISFHSPLLGSLADIDFNFTLRSSENKSEFQRTGSSSLIIPNISLEALDASHSALIADLGQRVNILAVDNNPFNGMDSTEVQKALEERPWLRVVDHHGVYNDGQELATFPRLCQVLPDLIAKGFLDQPFRVLTDKGNLDPDGILSQYLTLNPELLNQQEKIDFLTRVAGFTDFSMFGGEEIHSNYQTNDPVKRFSYALLQLINEENAAYVASSAGAKISELSAEEIRSFFLGAGHDQALNSDNLRVQNIYKNILNRDLPLILISPEKLPAYYEGLADQYEERLCFSSKNAQAVTQVWDEKIAYMLPETGYTQRLDKDPMDPTKGYQIYDWLAESVAQYSSSAPIHLRMRDDFYVISVRHERPGEIRQSEYDVSPIITIINKQLGRQALYGRKEVALGKISEAELAPLEVLDILKSNWDKIEQKQA